MQKPILERLIVDESGATAIEYGLIIAMVSVGIMGSLQIFGINLASYYGLIADAIGNALP